MDEPPSPHTRPPLSYTSVEVSEIIHTLGPPDLLVAKAWVGVSCLGGAFFLRENLLSSLLFLLLVVLLFSPGLLSLLRILALLSVAHTLGGALAAALGRGPWLFLAGEAGWGVGVGIPLLLRDLVVLLVLGPLPEFRGGLGPSCVRVFTALLRLVRIRPFLGILGGRLFCPFCRNNRAQLAPRVSPEPGVRAQTLYLSDANTCSPDIRAE